MFSWWHRQRETREALAGPATPAGQTHRFLRISSGWRLFSSGRRLVFFYFVLFRQFHSRPSVLLVATGVSNHARARMALDDDQKRRPVRAPICVETGDKAIPCSSMRQRSDRNTPEANTKSLLHANCVGNCTTPDKSPTSQASSTCRPLDGVHIVEIQSDNIAAPLAGKHLQNLGATVTVVVAPPSGECGSEANGWRGSAAEAALNDGKAIVDHGLLTDAHRLHVLISSADAVISGVHQTSARQLGVDAGTLHAINDRLIHVTLPAFAENEEGGEPDCEVGSPFTPMPPRQRLVPPPHL